jgi:hypothetical protein
MVGLAASFWNQFTTIVPGKMYFVPMELIGPNADAPIPDVYGGRRTYWM